MKVVNITNSGTQWRVFEKEKLEEHFGEVLDLPVGDLDGTKKILSSLKNQEFIVNWRPNSDVTNSSEHENILRQRELLKDIPCINDPAGYLNSHTKEKAFSIWQKEGVNCPRHIVIDEVDAFEHDFNYPILIRLNNEVSGQASYLVHNDIELFHSLKMLEGQYYRALQTNPFVKMIAVEFIDATKESGKYNMSYRIIVAGDKVVTGYARLSESSDWVAITGKFKPEMEESFVKYQKRCQNVIEQQHDAIVKAVHSLGLNHQGVDAIEDQEGNLYFLECQPGYSTGYAHWAKPFYNPYYPELVKFLVNNEERLKQEIPMYYNKWLNKETLFDEVMSSLREYVK